LPSQLLPVFRPVGLMIAQRNCRWRPRNRRVDGSRPSLCCSSNQWSIAICIRPGASISGISQRHAHNQAAPNSDCKASFSSAIVATTVMMRKFHQETALPGCVLIVQPLVVENTETGFKCQTSSFPTDAALIALHHWQAVSAPKTKPQCPRQPAP